VFVVLPKAVFFKLNVFEKRKNSEKNQIFIEVPVFGIDKIREIVYNKDVIRQKEMRKSVMYDRK